MKFLNQNKRKKSRELERFFTVIPHQTRGHEEMPFHSPKRRRRRNKSFYIYVWHCIYWREQKRERERKEKNLFDDDNDGRVAFLCILFSHSVLFCRAKTISTVFIYDFLSYFMYWYYSMCVCINICKFRIAWWWWWWLFNAFFEWGNLWKPAITNLNNINTPRVTNSFAQFKSPFRCGGGCYWYG